MDISKYLTAYQLSTVEMMPVNPDAYKSSEEIIKSVLPYLHRVDPPWTFFILNNAIVHKHRNHFDDPIDGYTACIFDVRHYVVDECYRLFNMSLDEVLFTCVVVGGMYKRVFTNEGYKVNDSMITIYVLFGLWLEHHK